ncbi:MAG: zinc ABC transporter substrate-binding protein [Bacteroidia bacterium]|nr:zinc ABC transporter substrate-binding protein [Bacteroidia bacterium]
MQRFLVGVGLALWVVLGCRETPSNEPTGDGPLRVTATTGMVADAARNLLGTAATVTALMGPGVDPHLYKATQGDLARLREADLVLYNGLHLEGKLNDLLTRLGQTQAVVALGELLPDSLRRQAPGFEGAYDPHLWFDVARWRTAVGYLADTLSARYPHLADSIGRNRAQYTQALDSLDRWVRAELSRLPPERRVLVTAHDAFGYFGAAYGVEVRGLQGLSTAAEFGVRDVSELVDFLVRRKIPAIFVESSVSPRAIESVVAQAAARGHRVRVGGTLYSDALGAAGTPEGTYIGMVRANVQTLVEALK